MAGRRGQHLSGEDWISLNPCCNRMWPEGKRKKKDLAIRAVTIGRFNAEFSLRIFAPYDIMEDIGVTLVFWCIPMFVTATA